jgi:hypothetical protein
MLVAEPLRHMPQLAASLAACSGAPAHVHSVMTARTGRWDCVDRIRSAVTGPPPQSTTAVGVGWVGLGRVVPAAAGTKLQSL